MADSPFTQQDFILSTLEANDELVQGEPSEQDRAAFDEAKRQREERMARAATYAKQQARIDESDKAEAESHGLTLAELRMARSTGMSPQEAAALKDGASSQEAIEVQAAEQARAEARAEAEHQARVAAEGKRLS